MIDSKQSRNPQKKKDVPTKKNCDPMNKNRQEDSNDLINSHREKIEDETIEKYFYLD